MDNNFNSSSPVVYEIRDRKETSFSIRCGLYVEIENLQENDICYSTGEGKVCVKGALGAGNRFVYTHRFFADRNAPLNFDFKFDFSTVPEGEPILVQIRYTKLSNKNLNSL